MSHEVNGVNFIVHFHKMWFCVNVPILILGRIVLSVVIATCKKNSDISVTRNAKKEIKSADEADSGAKEDGEKAKAGEKKKEADDAAKKEEPKKEEEKKDEKKEEKKDSLI